MRMHASTESDPSKNIPGASQSPSFDKLYDHHAEYVVRRNPHSYEAQQILLEVTRFKIPNLLSVIPNGFDYRSIAEIGCATGELIGAFPDRGPSGSLLTKYGFDISPCNIEAARERYKLVSFSDGDFSQCPAVDVVILSDVLEHVPDDVMFLRRASQIGKLVLVNLPLEDNWLNSWRNYGYSDSSGHLRRYSENQGRFLMAQAGLDILNSIRVWSHETPYDVERRSLRKKILGEGFGGPLAVRFLKSFLHDGARRFGPFGRRFYPSNLFLSAIKKADEIR